MKGRAKDLIESDGEWIPSAELEKTAKLCNGIAQAAAIGIAHPHSRQRPLLVVVRSNGSSVSADDVLTHFTGKVDKNWQPLAVEFAESLPLTSTGNVSRSQLRDRYCNFAWPQTQSVS
jgi:acyl-CoA synthetase (AMP-forming)/AMP-acid ligase II